MNAPAPVNTETSGGSRYSEGKVGGAWYAPLAGLVEVLRVANMGAAKYAPLDWKEGQSFSTLIDCTWRHLMAMLDEGPWAKAPDSGLYHAAHAAWNLLCLLTFMVKGRHDLDDITPWHGVTAAKKREAIAAAEAADVDVLELLRSAG